ncbi:hypothetical protein J14TS2_16630 [Bacillus sp. J14TS2]|uniref:hypothetical protein n=1 Tax=Bacillus sp. J14TS2 TaxID=2807188 RepID=UPI001AFFA365|nr:hypothetical protein [Bacillus sp. J14TS2]GIN71188.1 hypothetical protein J14TS2_16630 [Bacillus sp. J14TS2]
MEKLRQDIKEKKRTIHEIKLDQNANRKQKKKIKKIKRYIRSALSKHDGQVKKAIKLVKKEKEFEDTSKLDKKILKFEKKTETANKFHNELQKELDLKTSDFQFHEIVTIDKDTAKGVLQVEKEKQEKLEAKKKRLEKEEAEKQEKEQKILEEEIDKITKESKHKEDSTKQAQIVSEEEFDSWINDLIETGDGIITSVGPNVEGDWEVTNVFVSSEFFIPSVDKQLDMVESVGPAIQEMVERSGKSSYTNVIFRYEKDDRIIAEPKLFGGYKIN